jgi:hypothetical protein
MYASDMKKFYPQVNAADNRMLIACSILFAAMFLIGILLPSNWFELFGPLGLILQRIANFVPTIAGAASISSISEVVRGYGAIACVAAPLVSLYLIVKDPTRQRYAFAWRPTMQSNLKKFFFFYFLYLPSLIFLIWCYWSFPAFDTIGNKVTWGQKIFFNMVNNRIYLSVFGSFFVACFPMFFLMFMTLILGPINVFLFQLKGK